MAIPVDQLSPYAMERPATGSPESKSPPAQVAHHQRHRYRGDNDDPAGGLPIFLRFKNLVAANIVGSWTQLLRMIEDDGFPVGIMLGANTRVWRLDAVQTWLDSRPTARKIPPPVKDGKQRGRRKKETDNATATAVSEAVTTGGASAIDC